MSTNDKGAPPEGGDGKRADGEGPVKPHVRRKVARSAATTERASFEAAEAPAGAPEVDLPRVEVAAEPPRAAASAPDARAAERAVVGGPAAEGASAGGPSAGGPSGGPAPRPAAPRGAGKTGEGRWDMRAPSGAGRGPSGFRGRPRPGDGGQPRRPGASGGRASPFIPERDADGNPIERARPGASGGRASPFIPRRDADGNPLDGGRGPRPERRGPGGPGRPDRPRRPREDGAPRPEGARDARPDRPRRDAEAAAPRRPAAPAAPPAPEPPKAPTVAETIFLGLPRAKLERETAKDANKPKTAKEALRAKTLAAKPKADAPAKPGKAELDPAWIAASEDGAVAAARAAGAAGEALVDAWAKAQNGAALAEVEAAEDLPGSVRKAARRALHALRGKGVAVPERKRETAATSADLAVWEATFLPPDGRGTVAFTVAKKLPDGRLHVAEVIARDPQGIAQAATAWLSRTQLREGHQRASARAGIAPVPVPVEWARACIAEARKLNAISGTLLPLGLEACKELIEPATDAQHPLAALEATLADDAATAPASMHTEAEFRGWLPDPRAIDEMLRKLGEALGPEGSKDAERVSKGLEEEVRNATDRFFTPEVRATVARRLRDAAISIRSRLGEERAKQVLATARAVERAGLISDPPRDVPFLVAYFQKAVAILLQQGNGALRIPMGTGVPAAV